MRLALDPHLQLCPPLGSGHFFGPKGWRQRGRPLPGSITPGVIATSLESATVDSASDSEVRGAMYRCRGRRQRGSGRRRGRRRRPCKPRAGGHGPAATPYGPSIPRAAYKGRAARDLSCTRHRCTHISGVNQFGGYMREESESRRQSRIEGDSLRLLISCWERA